MAEEAPQVVEKEDGLVVGRMAEEALTVVEKEDARDEVAMGKAARQAMERRVMPTAAASEEEVK